MSAGPGGNGESTDYPQKSKNVKRYQKKKKKKKKKKNNNLETVFFP